MSWLTDLLGLGGRPNPEYVLPRLCKEFDDAPLTPLSAASDPNDPALTKIEQLGEIKVMHGFGTAELPGGKTIIKVEQRVVQCDHQDQTRPQGPAAYVERGRRAEGR
jgi:hypothetical protein